MHFSYIFSIFNGNSKKVELLAVVVKHPNSSEELFSDCLKVKLFHFFARSYAARNLPAIESQLDVRIACEGLQQKFQHAEHFTCDSLISILIQFPYGFHQ